MHGTGDIIIQARTRVLETQPWFAEEFKYTIVNRGCCTAFVVTMEPLR